MALTEKQVESMVQLKAYRPFMLVYGAVHKTTGEFRLGAVPTMRTPNRLARDGWHVEVIGATK
jgi:hypothetical protein